MILTRGRGALPLHSLSVMQDGLHLHGLPVAVQLVEVVVVGGGVGQVVLLPQHELLPVPSQAVVDVVLQAEDLRENGVETVV